MKKRAIAHARDAAGLVVNPVEYRNNQMRRAAAIEEALKRLIHVAQRISDDWSGNLSEAANALSDELEDARSVLEQWPGEFDTSETIRELTRRMKISLAAKKAETRR